MSEKRERRKLPDSIRRGLPSGELVLALCMALLLAGLCAVQGLSATENLDFSPINGSFQNYNVVRRFLGGQVPCADFFIYLGLGHLLTGSAATLLFGGDFAGSMAGFQFASLAAFCLLACVMGWAVLGRGKKLLWLSCAIFLTAMVLTQPLFFTSALGGFEEVVGALNASLSPGNSARYVRGLIVPLSILLAKIACSLTGFLSQRLGLKPALYRRLVFILLSCASGFSLLWSNDYGIACWLCSLLLTIFIALCSGRGALGVLRSLGAGLLHGLISLGSLFVLVSLLTRGRFESWAADAFGTGGYQFWYYGYWKNKSYYLWDIDFSFLTLLQAALCLYYLWKLFRGRRDLAAACRRCGVPAYANMAGYAVINECRLLSSGNLLPTNEVAYTILFFTLFYEGVSLLVRLAGRDRAVRLKWGAALAAMLLGVSLLASTGLTQLRDFYTSQEDRGAYIAELGGFLQSRSRDVLEAKAFVGEETVFSTYASALEVVTGQFQPSGADYIIHVLGDGAREDYMDRFRAGGFRYVTTIQESFTSWEHWTRHANWFFYRELYEQYRPVYATAYQVFWEKNAAGGPSGTADLEEIHTEVIQNGPGSVTIRVQAGRPVNGVADVLVRYGSALVEGDPRSLLTINRSVFVDNSGDQAAHSNQNNGWHLRTAGQEYLPISIVNGAGEVTLHSMPAGHSTLEVAEAACGRIFTFMFDYIDTLGAHGLGGGLARISVLNTPHNQLALQGAAAIRAGERTYWVSRVETAGEVIWIDVPCGDLLQLQLRLEESAVCRVGR